MKAAALIAPVALLSLATSIGVAALLVTDRLREAVTAPSPAIACDAPTRAFVRRELIFGTARAQGRPVGESDWQSFLDSAVTPRFPDGFTVIDARGQWTGNSGLIREQSRILVIWHDLLPRRDADIEAIRAVYKQRFDQDSVLRIDSVSCVSF